MAPLPEHMASASWPSIAAPAPACVHASQKEAEAPRWGLLPVGEVPKGEV